MTGQRHLHLCAGIGGGQGCRTFVRLLVCTAERRDVERRDVQVAGRFAQVDPLVEHALRAAPHFDTAVPPHELQTFDDVADRRPEVGPAGHEVVREPVQCHAEVGLGAVHPGLLDAHAAGADQGVVRQPGPHGESGAVDDGVGIVVHAVAGADADGGPLLDRRRDDLDAAATGEARGATQSRDAAAGGERGDLDRRCRTGHQVDQFAGAGIGPDDRYAPASRVEIGFRHRRADGGAAKLPAAEQVRDPRNERRLAGDHDAAAAEFAAVGGQRPGIGGVVEHRVGYLAIEDHEVADAGRQQLGGSVPVADEDNAVNAFGHRNFVRVQPRRASGPINPTSDKNAASGANPAIWTSWRCALLRAILRASRAFRPARAYWTWLLNRWRKNQPPSPLMLPTNHRSGRRIRGARLRSPSRANWIWRGAFSAWILLRRCMVWRWFRWCPTSRLWRAVI